jgi:chaperone required for assembly of F1-ATPase
MKRAFSSGALHHVKKFYKNATVVPYSDASGQHLGYSVKLDKKSLSTADGHRYFVPNAWLAHLVSLEFLSQKDYIVSTSMPLVS